MSRFKLFFFIFSLCFQFYFAQISDKRLCIDAECSQPISKAKTVLAYSAPDRYRLSFRPNEDVIIYSYSAGSNEDLWGAEIRGKRGYIPKTFVRELKKLKTPTILVDTELGLQSKTPEVPSEDTVRPSKVKQTHEVIDGTTILLEANDKESDKNNEDSSNENDNKELEEEVEGSTETGGLFGSVLGSMMQMVNPTQIEEDNPEDENEEPVNQSKESGENIDQIPSNENTTIDQNVEDNKDSSESLIGKQELDSSEALHNVSQEIPDISQNQEISESVETNSDIKENEVDKQISNENQSDELNSIKNESLDVTLETSSETPKNLEENLEEKLNVDNSSEVSLETSSETLEKVENIQVEPLKVENSDPSPEKIADSIQNVNESESSTKTEEKVEGSQSETSKTDKLEVNSLESSKENEVKQTEYSVSFSESIVSNLNESKNPIIENQTEASTVDEGEKNSAEIEVTPENNQLEPQIVDVSSDNSSDSQETPDKSQFDSSNNEDLKDNSSEINENVDNNEKEETNESKPSELDNKSGEIDMKNESSSNVPQQEPSKPEESAVSSSEIDETKGKSFKPDESAISSSEIDETKEIPQNSTFEIQKEATFEQTHSVFTPIPTEIRSNIQETQSEFQNSVESNENHNDSHEIEQDKPIESSFFYSTPSYAAVTPPHPTLEEITEKPDTTQKSEETNIGNSENLYKAPEIVHTAPDINENISEEILNESYENQHEKSLSSGELKENEEKIVDSGIFSYFGKSAEDVRRERSIEAESNEKIENQEVFNEQHCNKENEYGYSIPMELNLSSDLFLYLITTAISVLIFLLGYIALDKSRREVPLISKINKLEKEFLVILKEKELLIEKIENGVLQSDQVATQDYINLQQEYENVIEQKQLLEEQVQTLEKELENSTEVGLELNRMLSDLLTSENAGETLMANIEQLQAKLAEQLEIVSNMKETVSLKETENHELNLELDIANKKVVELQSELDKLLLNIIKVEEEKESLEKNYQTEILKLKDSNESLKETLEKHQIESSKTIEDLNNRFSTSERNLQLKIKEYEGLKESMEKLKTVKNANTLVSLLEVNSIKAELDQLKIECQTHCANLQKEKETNTTLEKRTKSYEKEIEAMSRKFDETDKAKLEIETKLQVLTNYFKDRETQLQKELSKYESMWSAKQGEATSTSERIKYLQSEVQNYKSQNESLKEEIVAQEVELKSQISVLEKKVHENWLSARQAERRLEDLKQEAAQLRNRLTLRERALQEDKNRMQSPLDQNGDLPISPLHIESPSSPPLLYNSRDHITKSPAMMGMPHSFLPPPPPGAPFLPPPHMPFMPPPPPDMFPGDHRPPPLGRMSSPPLNSRYSPDRRPYSPYDRRSPSPSYDESEYGTSPVHHRGGRYSPPYRMDHRRMPPPIGKINGRSGGMSSGSGNSNESLDELNHSNSKV